jgi:GDPmannose 4,6-dehydratase
MARLSNNELSKTWLLTGIKGMDGSLFADLLLSKGYTNIHGIIRRSAVFNTQNIDHIFDKLQLHYGDLTDAMNIYTIISSVKPDYIVNFAAQSHVAVSSELENYTLQVNTIGVLNILQSVRMSGLEKTCRIYQCGTSEEWGNATDGSRLLNEMTPKVPVSIYGVSKLAAEHICNIYRDAYGMYIVCGTLLNHENARRNKTFAPAKIADYVGKYYNKKISKALEMGNIYAKRDWSDARDMVYGIYLMLTQEIPKNYVLGSGTCYSIKDFIEIAFKEIGVTLRWSGSGANEVAFDNQTNNVLVKINPRYYRDIDINCLIGDSSTARKELGWRPKISFDQMVKDMIQNAIRENA